MNVTDINTYKNNAINQINAATTSELNRIEQARQEDRKTHSSQMDIIQFITKMTISGTPKDEIISQAKEKFGSAADVFLKNIK